VRLAALSNLSPQATRMNHPLPNQGVHLPQLTPSNKSVGLIFDFHHGRSLYTNHNIIVASIVDIDPSRNYLPFYED
jgi:hypothetical protein